jgi:hypothetical protein
MGIGARLLSTPARKLIASRSPEHHALVRKRWKAARAYLRVAERLDPKWEAEPAYALYRAGLVPLVVAAMKAHDAKADVESIKDVDSAWRALKDVWPKLGIKADLGELPEDAVGASRAIDRLSVLLEPVVEPRDLRVLGWVARARVAALALVPIALAAWLVPPLFEPKCLTLNKPVKVSSGRESEAPPDGHDVVNGRIEHTYGMQTNEEDTPWVVVDLEKPTMVHRIVVYNRGDGWFGDCLPLTLEVGLDESKLRVVETRNTMFTQHRPWTVQLSEEIRFIKLSKKGLHGYITLAEISAY